MKKKFDAYEALRNEGFAESINEFGCVELSRKFEKEIEVVWYGKSTKTFAIIIEFNSDKTAMRVWYYNRPNCPSKVKDHLNDKRAYNAIHSTAKYNGFEF